MWLDRLVGATRSRLEDGYYDRRPAAFLTSPPSLRAAVERARPAVVAEVKPARPDGTRWNVDPGAQARAYASGGACGISVLTDPDHFQGDLANLQAARSVAAPILMKDFLIDERQADAARAWGASAALVIARLPREGYTELTIAEAVEALHALDLEALVEVVTEEELDDALDAGADVIGINERDLDTLDQDVDRTRRLLEGRDLPGPVLHLSGVQGPADVRRALQAGAQGVLVGTAAMDASDPAAFIRSLREVPA